jgi:hypothetical protein
MMRWCSPLVVLCMFDSLGMMSDAGVARDIQSISHAVMVVREGDVEVKVIGDGDGNGNGEFAIAIAIAIAIIMHYARW